MTNPRPWPGQFNLDFMGFLALSAIWVAWRHQFSAGGLGLAVLAFFGGMLFLSIYLLIHTSRAGGDIKVGCCQSKLAGSVGS